MRYFYLTVCLFFVVSNIFSQTGTEFWFAPPNVTNNHRPADQDEVYLNITCLDQDASIRIWQPANASGLDMTVNLSANTSQKIYLGGNITDLETKPTNTILNTGLLIESTANISAYYEYDNYNNPDIFALKGSNALGQEFYIPLHNYEPYYNHTYSDTAYASFDIVATEDNTEVRIYPTREVNGHPALQQFTITLNRGQTYSCAWTGTNYQSPSTHPYGSAVLSDKPIAISIKDDSNHGVTGCYDLLGDQIVPVDIIGDEYIIVKGQLNAADDEGFFVLATQNNTEVYINGAATPITTLFAGEMYRYDISDAGQDYTFVKTSAPVYLTHTTGFGCEIGQAILPPLNCAGSEDVSFVRSTNEAFFLTLLIKSASVNDFTITPASAQAKVDAATWSTVPGTAGEWSATTLQFTVAEIPVGTANRLTNSSNIFAMGLINGGGTSGCRYGYFSQFVSEIISDAGADQTICANTTATLNGSVTGGATTGIWSSSGSGSFDDATSFNAIYTPSFADKTAGSVTLTLSSTGLCFPTSDDMLLTFDPAPTVDAGIDQTVCANNSDVSLNGVITVATGGLWSSSGDGAFDNTSLMNATYTPGANDITAGNVKLYLTTTGNGSCTAEIDSLTITITSAPTINAGVDLSSCINNPDITLNAIATIASGGQWSGGTGSFNPGSGALNTIYTPSATELANGSVVLTVTTTGNGTCAAVSDDILLSFTPSPIVNAGIDQVKCANNEVTVLNGNISGGATAGVWSNGLGTFVVDNTDLNASYTPTATEIANGSVTLTLTSSDHASNGCLAVNDQMTISFTPAPTANAGTDQTVCANNANVSLTGAVTVASGGIWSTSGSGSFSPSNTLMNTNYVPSNADKAAGSIMLYLTTTGNATCTEVKDSMLVTITAAPTANAGLDQSVCANNADITLNGSGTVATAWQWTGGSGSYNPGNTALNTIYTPSAAEIASGSITLTLNSTAQGTCNTVNDDIIINFTPAPVVTAGADQVKCANNEVTTLNGNISNGASTGVWTNGLGTFVVDNTDLNASYTPTATEIANGSVTLTLTSSDHASNGCNAESDQMTISFTPAPTADAGADQTVCANNANVGLTGAVTVATGGIWSTSGSGSFSPSNTSMNTNYVPSNADKTAGSVMLYLTTTGNASCTEVKDSMLVTITAAPTVNAGLNQSVCANNADITLNGSGTVATAWQWTGGSGAYNPGNTALNTIYTPSAAEIASGSITLTLNSTAQGTCNAVSDDIVISFTSSPVVTAGADQVKCANNALTTLNGNISGGASAGVWTNGLGTFVVDNTDLSASYTPTATEIANGSVTLTLTSSDHTNNACSAESDQMTISFTPAPTVNAGTNQTVCANNATVSLSGAVTVATGGIWSTAGTGSFSPSNTLMNTNYIPSNADKTAGSVMLYLTTTGNASCTEVKDSILVTITPAPTVNAGLDQSVCANNADITLNGSSTIATAWQWSGGSGAYNPGNTAINTIYSPSAAEIASGSITLTLSSTAQGACNAVSDDIIISFTPEPQVNAGADQVKCANNELTNLNGSVSGGATTGVWSNGLGTFVVDNTDLNASYTPTATEIANGSVTLTLSSSDHASNGCSIVSDQMTISFTNAPTVDAGTDQTVCQNNANLILNGSVGIASGGTWSGGSGNFANPNNLNTSYTPSASEIAAGVPITLTLSTTGNGTCNAETDQMIVDFDPSPIVEAGAPQTSCANNPTVVLQGSVVNAGGGIWSGSSGSFSPSNADVLATFTPTATDILNGGVNLTLSSTSNGTCNPESDIFSLSILPAPIVDAGADQTLCANNATISLNGNVSNATGGTWSGGLGIYGDANVLSTSYQPAQSEIDNGFVTLYLTSTGNGTCNAVQDEVTFTFTQAPTIDAGIDQTVCANNSDVVLSGSVSMATGGVWSGGLGTFSPDANSLNTIYHPSAAEISAQSLSLTLTSTGNGSCISVSDVIDIIINPSPIVNAGSDINVCYNNASATLNGNISNATGGIWTGGSGTFTPDNTTLNASYIPTQAELDAGQIQLYLSSTGNGSCNAVSDSVLIIIDPAPIVSAGTDQTVCENNAEVVLNGSVNNATGGIWSSGLGIFTPNNSILNATYTPTTDDLNTGYVDLTLSSTGNGNCNAVEDVVRINFTPAPTVDAGTDIEICANNAFANLEGIITVASGGIWSGGIGSYNPSATDLNNVYTPTATEIANGSLTLTLTSTGNGLCNAVSDDVNITINPAPIVDAGEDQNICVDNLVAHLNGSVSGITNEGQWSSSGTGFFVPNANSLNADYVCSSADSTFGTVTLTLTSTNNDACLAVSDIMTLHILPAGQADAGADQTVCANNAAIYLNGSVSGGASTGTWTSGGTGAFIPDANTLNATYIPSNADTLTGSVSLTLTANACNVATSTMLVTITPAPQVSAGDDQMVCVDDLEVQLEGQVFGATNTGSWSTTGTGTFTPGTSSLDAIYTASSQDSLNGFVELVLSATNYGDCLPVRDTVLITISPAGIVSAGPDQAFCSNNSNIQLNGQISGGASQGQWGTSGSGYFLPSADSLNASYIPSAADLSMGSVTLVLSATNSCNFAFDALEVNFTDAPTVDAGEDESLCANNAELTLSGNFSIATGAVWSSSGTGTFFPSNTNMNAVYTPSAADVNNGGAHIFLTTTGNGECLAVTDTVVLEITPAPIVSTGPDQTVCFSATETQLFGYISGGSITGEWTSLGSGSFDDPTDLNANYIFSPSDVASGLVKLVLTSTNNGYCFAESDTMSISFGNSTFAYAGVDQNICADDLLVNLSGIVTGGTTTGIWSSSGTGSFNPSVNDLNATYTCSAQDSINGSVHLILTTTNNGGCNAGVDSMEVSIIPAPIIFAGNDIEVCKGIDSVSIAGNASHVGSVQWSSSGSGSFAPSDTSLSAYYYPSSADTLIGSVVLTLSSNNTAYCNEVSDQVIISFSKPLNVDFSHNLACVNQTVNFSDETDVLAGSIDSWYWEFGDGGTDNNQNPSHTFLTEGNYNVTLNVASSLGCSYSYSQNITVHTSPIADFTYVSDCYLDEVMFTDASTTDLGSIDAWTWTFEDSINSNLQNPEYLFGNSGNYIVSLSVQNSLGCSATSQQSVEVHPKPIADFTYNFNCDDGTVSFNDASVSNGDPISFWQWSFGDGNTDNIENPSHNFASSGSQTVELISGSSDQCRDTISQQVFLQSVTADFNFISQCQYDSIAFNNLSYTNGDSINKYTWIFNDGNSSNEAEPSHLFALANNYDVILVAESVTGCKDSVTKSVEVYPVPTAGFDFDSDDYKIDEVIEFSDLSNEAESWQWNFGDGITSSIQDPQHIYNNEGTYTVLQVVSNSYNCLDTAETGINIKPGLDVLPPKLPTAFSPNEDGLNDIYYPRGGPFRIIEFKIYNAWGKLIFSTTTIGEGWDGKYNGIDQPIGVYVWTISAVTIDNHVYKKTGDVNLIR